MTEHYSFWVCGPIFFMHNIHLNNSDITHLLWQMSTLSSFIIPTKSSLNYDILLHLTFCFSSLSPFFSILVYRENWHFWSVLKQSCCFSYLLITIWGLQRQYLHLKNRAGDCIIFTLYKWNLLMWSRNGEGIREQNKNSRESYACECMGENTFFFYYFKLNQKMRQKVHFVPVTVAWIENFSHFLSVSPIREEVLYESTKGEP